MQQLAAAATATASRGGSRGAARRAQGAEQSGGAAARGGARAGSAESAELRSARRGDGGNAGNISNEIANANAARDCDERAARQEGAANQEELVSWHKASGEAKRRRRARATHRIRRRVKWVCARRKKRWRQFNRL